jgi:hypothetical protein
VSAHTVHLVSAVFSSVYLSLSRPETFNLGLSTGCHCLLSYTFWVVKVDSVLNRNFSG